MYVYKISELLNNLSNAQKDGFEYVNLSILEAEDDMSETLCLDYVDSYDSSEEDMIDEIILPDDYMRAQ